MKHENFSSKFKKARIIIHITHIQYSFESPSHSNQRRNRCTKDTNWKGRIKTVTVCKWHDSIYENFKDSTRKQLQLINEFGKFAGYKISIQKSVAFLYTNNKLLER